MNMDSLCLHETISIFSLKNMSKENLEAFHLLNRAARNKTLSSLFFYVKYEETKVPVLILNPYPLNRITEDDIRIEGKSITEVFLDNKCDFEYFMDFTFNENKELLMTQLYEPEYYQGSTAMKSFLSDNGELILFPNPYPILFKEHEIVHVVQSNLKRISTTIPQSDLKRNVLLRRKDSFKSTAKVLRDIANHISKGFTSIESVIINKEEHIDLIFSKTPSIQTVQTSSFLNDYMQNRIQRSLQNNPKIVSLKLTKKDIDEKLLNIRKGLKKIGIEFEYLHLIRKTEYGEWQAYFSPLHSRNYMKGWFSLSDLEELTQERGKIMTTLGKEEKSMKNISASLKLLLESRNILVKSELFYKKDANSGFLFYFNPKNDSKYKKGWFTSDELISAAVNRNSIIEQEKEEHKEKEEVIMQ